MNIYDIRSGEGVLNFNEVVGHARRHKASRYLDEWRMDKIDTVDFD